MTASLEGLSFPQRFLVRLILCLFFDLLRVENVAALERLNGSGEPVIFVFNHNNSIETVLAAAVLLFTGRGRKVSFVVDWVYGYVPLVGRVISLVEPIFVYNKKAKFAFMNRHKTDGAKIDVQRECVAALRRDNSLAVFPEGKRNSNPQKLLRGRNGIGHIALQTDAAILPIGIDFPARLAKNKIPAFGQIIFRIGQQLDLSDEIAATKRIGATDELSPRLRQKLLIYLDNLVTHRAMLALSELSGKTYPFNPPVAPSQADSFLSLKPIRNAHEVSVSAALER